MTVFVLLAIILGRSMTRSSARTGPDWNRAFTTYAQDPSHNRRALLALRRYETSDLHPIYLLGLADAQLRARRYGAAREEFAAALDRDLGQPFAAWAAMGLGWAAMAGGDYAAARG